MIRALVTGCAGFIGSHVTETLLRDGAHVLGVDCFNDNYGRAQKLRNLSVASRWDRFEFVPVDLSRGDLGDLVDGVDVVYHLAAEPGVRSSWGSRFGRYVQNNVVGTQHLLDALKVAPGPRLVYASSSSIYGQAEQFPTTETAVPRPLSPYGVTKLAAEHLCHLYCSNHGVHTTSLRYFTVFGPRQRPDMAFHIFSRAALAGEKITVYGDGRQTRDFTYVQDVVDITIAAGTADIPGGENFNIGGGFRTSLANALEVIGDLSGESLDVEFGPREYGDVKDTGADTTRAQEILGFSPQFDLRVGLTAEFEWIKSEFDVLGAAA